jgi:hypothetical protein
MKEMGILYAVTAFSDGFVTTEANLRVGHTECKGCQEAEIDHKDGKVDTVKENNVVRPLPTEETLYNWM